MRIKFILFIFSRSIGTLRLFLICLASVVIIFHWPACKEKTTAPPTDNVPDTTSHDFTWRIDTLGTYGSVLYDVSVISPDNIWAVGEIHTEETDRFDSLGNWIQPYNAVHWDGDDWELRRIRTNSCGGVEYPPIKTIKAFAFNDILFAHLDGSITSYNGLNFTNNCSLIMELNGSARKIWGISKNDYYVVSGNGFIAHYNGSSWLKLESGTTIDLLDIYGSPDGSVVWACGYTDFVGTVLLKITGTTVEKVYEDNDYWFTARDDSLYGVLTSLWTDESDRVFLVSPYGVFRANASTHGEAERISMNRNYFPGFPRSLRGNGENDLFLAGDLSSLSHYNGSTWRFYDEYSGRIRSYSITVHNNHTTITGKDIMTDRAIIISKSD